MHFCGILELGWKLRLKTRGTKLLTRAKRYVMVPADVPFTHISAFLWTFISQFQRAAMPEDGGEE